MKYLIACFAVFLLAVDLTFSLQCYVCNDKHFINCENPRPRKCRSPRNVTCLTLRRARDIHSIYACGSKNNIDCTKYPDGCITCRGDLCNKPDNKTTQNSLKCYECYGDYYSDGGAVTKPKPPTSYYACSSVHSSYDDNAFKAKCYADEKCVTASSDLELRRYHGCVKDTKNFCSQYEYDKCTFCDKDFCNKVEPLYFTTCYKCYLGNYNAKFEDAKNCSHSETKTCGYGLQCLRAYDNNGEARYHDCGPISNNTDECSKNYGLDQCELCDDSYCNHPEIKKCYKCGVGDITPLIDRYTGTNFLINLTMCSQPAIVDCYPSDLCLTSTIRKNGKLIGAYHTCTFRGHFEDSCKKEGIDCQYCNRDLCNKLGDYTAVPPLTEISATTAISAISAVSAPTAISPHKKKCYDCHFGDLSPMSANHLINSTNCSQPTITLCGLSESCLSLTIKKNATLIGAFHTCTTSSYFEEDCKREEIDCQYCDDDLCNKVENYSYTAITPFRRTSSAEALKNNSVSLLNLLFIFIIIHAAL